MESIYGARYQNLEEIMYFILDEINKVREETLANSDSDPIEHIIYRIKSENSMIGKLKRKGLPLTAESATESVYDAVGIRVVCAFLKDVYMICDHLKCMDGCEVVEEKDYIKHAKENGYRSYHLILRVNDKGYAEIQLRTISQDTWAALEHNIHYKKEKTEMEKLIAEELKRCADELASTDLSMQTIRDMIENAERSIDQ